MNHPNVETIDQYACPNCDGNLIFDPNSQSLKCPYCETLVSLVSEELIEEHEFERYKQQGLTWDQDVHSFQCEACGASLVTEAHISSSIARIVTRRMWFIWTYRLDFDPRGFFLFALINKKPFNALLNGFPNNG